MSPDHWHNIDRGWVTDLHIPLSPCLFVCLFVPWDFMGQYHLNRIHRIGCSCFIPLALSRHHPTAASYIAAHIVYCTRNYCNTKSWGEWKCWFFLLAFISDLFYRGSDLFRGSHMKINFVQTTTIKETRVLRASIITRKYWLVNSKF